MTLEKATEAFDEIIEKRMTEVCEFCGGAGAVGVAWHRTCQACFGTGQIELEASVADMGNGEYLIAWGAPR